MNKKFRAWDTRVKRYLENDDWCLNSDGVGMNVLLHTIINDEFYTFGHANLDIEQWTGLTDKNDKEIYEGDVIKIGGKDHLIRYICWDDDNCSLMMQPIPRCIYTNDRQPFKEEWVENKGNNRVEVIGNIHENKSLLESEGL